MEILSWSYFLPNTLYLDLNSPGLMLSITHWVLISFLTCSKRSSITVVIFWQHITMDRTEASFVSSIAGTIELFEFWREFWTKDPSSKTLFKTELEVGGEFWWFCNSNFRWSSANSSRFSFKFTVEVELVEAAVESVEENRAGLHAAKDHKNQSKHC